MSAELLYNGNLKIEEYNFAEFLLAFQKAVLEGFYLDLESNDNYPQRFGDHLYVILKGNADEVTNNDTQDTVVVVLNDVVEPTSDETPVIEEVSVVASEEQAKEASTKKARKTKE